MNERAAEALRLMAAIEGELRRLGLWEAQAPPPAALMSAEPFCFDTLTFTQWLQWVFIVRVRETVRDGRPLPGRSDIHPLAEHVFETLDYDSGPLLAHLLAFDSLISNSASTR